MDKQTRQALAAFANGTNDRAQEVLGAHFTRKQDRDGVIFRTWAPAAARVSVVGDFNGWDPAATPMRRQDPFGVWTAFVPGLARYAIYKYCVRGADGKDTLKSDPFALHFETPPANASQVYAHGSFRWGDKRWLNKRTAQARTQHPINIYEVHPGSWRRYADGNCFDYEKLGQELAAYAVDMGYTHVELMPLTEHPFDGSWGYQVTGYFAPTSRFGTPRGMMQLVNTLHKAGIGVILDWVPAHFPKDEHGLYKYDGTCCFEYSDPTKKEHKGWGTRVFDYAKPQVQSFLISSALYWIEQFHLDGLRLDAVASMLYLDYDRQTWRPNINGGRENLEAVEFLKKLCTTVLTQYPDVMLIAEESTAWPMVTRPPGAGGLGFTHKWNMGWMNDTLDYISLEPPYRSWSHDKLTFSMYYAFSERYLLPISHDEVVHGKRSLIERMPGTYEEKFAGVRLLLGYMMSHPGGKLTFMGCEFGQFIEWDYRRELDWLLLEYESHRKLQDYVRALNHFYRERSPLWQVDDSWEGFQWVEPGDSARNTIAFRRLDERDRELLVVCNFAPEEHPDYRLGVPLAEGYRVVFSSDEARFGGMSPEEAVTWPCEPVPAHSRDHSICMRVPPLSVTWLEPVGPLRGGRPALTKTQKKT